MLIEYGEKERLANEASVDDQNESVSREETAEENPDEQESGDAETEAPDGESDAGEDAPEQRDDETYRFVVKSESGKEVERDYTAAELQEILENHEKGGGTAEKQLYEFVDNVKPLVERFTSSPLLQQVVQWQDQGFSDTQIMKGLYDYVGQQNNAKPANEKKNPEQDEYQKNMIEWMRSVVKQEITPIKQKLTEKEAVEQTGQTIAHNTKVFEEALNKYYYKPELLSKGQRDKLEKTLKSALGDNVDLKRYKISKDQADMIVNYALGPRKGAIKEQNKTAQMIKQSGAPVIMPGRSARPMAKKTASNDSTTISSRRSTFNSLFQLKD